MNHNDSAADRDQILDEISRLGAGPDGPHVCDTCGRWLPCRHCTKETK